MRVVVVTSTRARAEGPPDELSDYDVIVALEDIDRFDAAAAYGTPAARWGDEHDVHGTKTFFRGVVYDDGVKVDWTLWPANVPELVGERGLTDDLDVGYRVLLDKDRATARWAQPTYRAHIPRRPTEAEYLALVEEFWWSATYVAKARAREEQFFLRFVLDVDMTHGVLRQMLEWLIETSRGWDGIPAPTAAGSSASCRPTSLRSSPLRTAHSSGRLRSSVGPPARLAKRSVTPTRSTRTTRVSAYIDKLR